MTGNFPAKELHSWLRHAAGENNVERVQALIAQGANPYDVDEQGLSAFNHANSNGLEVLRYLTEIAFADTQKPAAERRWPAYGINTPSGAYDSTLLTYACKACDAGTVRAMINAGADPAIVNKSGWNLLHAAAVMPGRLELIKLLRETLGIESLKATTSQPYETRYGKQLVTYVEELTPAELCIARMDQDKNHPAELKDYLPWLSPCLRATPIASENIGLIS